MEVKLLDLDQMNYVDKAERVINDTHKNSLSTSQLRNILSKATLIFEKAQRKTGDLTEEEQGDIQLLRVNIIYSSGRDRGVKNFVQKSNLLNYIKEIGKSREKLILFCRYIEALVAYHKFRGGK